MVGYPGLFGFLELPEAVTFWGLQPIAGMIPSIRNMMVNGSCVTLPLQCSSESQLMQNDGAIILESNMCHKDDAKE